MIFDLTVPGGMGGKEAVEEIRNQIRKSLFSWQADMLLIRS